MMRPALPLLAALLLALNLAPRAGAADNPAEPGVIHSSAQGVVLSVPDLAVLSMEIVREGDSADALRPEVNAVIEAVLAAARELQVEDGDIRASDLQVQPRYHHNPATGLQTISGVRVTRPLRVTLRDIADLPELIDAALAAGVNNVGSAILALADPKAAQDEAIAQATASALERARVAAASLGLALGSVRSVHVNVSDGGGNRFMSEALVARASLGGSTSASFEEGQISSTANVNLTVELRAPDA